MGRSGGGWSDTPHPPPKGVYVSKKKMLSKCFLKCFIGVEMGEWPGEMMILDWNRCFG